MRPSHSSNKRGFTLVELLIVIVVIAILTAITIVAYNGITNRAHIAVLQTDLHNAATALELYNVTNGTYPPDLATAALPASNGTTYQYSLITNPVPGWCLTATNSSISYFVNNTTTTTPTAGGCPGDGTGGLPSITNLAQIPLGINANVPSGEAGFMSGRWFGSNPATGTYSLITNASDGPAGISSYLRKVWSVAPASNGDTGFGIANSNSTAAGSTGLPVTAGQAYVFSSYMRPSSSGKIADIQVYWHASDGTYLSTNMNTQITLVAGSWNRLSLSVTAPTNAATVGIVSDIDSGTLWAVGDTLDGTGLMITQGSTLYNYGDGNSSGWKWNGAINASTSTGPQL